MEDLEKDGPIIELTDVVEEAPGPAAGRWMETTPPPAPAKKASDPAGAKKEDPYHSPADLKGLPDSPLKKFILPEEELPAPGSRAEEGKPAAPSPGPKAQAPSQEKTAPGFGPPGIPPEPPVGAPEAARTAPERPRAPEPPRATAQGPRPAPEPDRPSPPIGEAEMRAMREALLARVEKWCGQEGAGVLERVAREMFPGIAERVIRQEIEKVKAKAEEKE